MVKLQDEIDSKEDERILALRRRFEERTVRFMNAKQRSIGIDRNELDRQIQEKEQQRQAERRAIQDEVEYQNQLCRYLEELELSSREARVRDVKDVQSTLLKQMQLPKNNAPTRGDPLDMDACGVSSVQCFVGEDRGKANRVQMQKEQIRKWCINTINEKRQVESLEEEEKNRYSRYVLAEDSMRVSLAEADANDRFETNKKAQAENLELARQAQLRKYDNDERERALNEAEVLRLSQSQLLTEDTDFANSFSSPHRFRPDHFKGFDKDKIKQIHEDNQRVIDEKMAINAREAQEEDNWAVHQSDVVSQLERFEIEQQRSRAEQNRIQAIELEEQRRELKEKQERMKADKFGAIGEGFFNKFGTSCR